MLRDPEKVEPSRRARRGTTCNGRRTARHEPTCRPDCPGATRGAARAARRVAIRVDALEDEELAGGQPHETGPSAFKRHVAEGIASAERRHRELREAGRVVLAEVRRVVVGSRRCREAIRPPVGQAHVVVELLHEHAQRHDRLAAACSCSSSAGVEREAEPDRHVGDVEIRRALRFVGLPGKLARRRQRFPIHTGERSTMVPAAGSTTPLDLAVEIDGGGTPIASARTCRIDRPSRLAPCAARVAEQHVLAPVDVRLLGVVGDERSAVGQVRRVGVSTDR